MNKLLFLLFALFFVCCSDESSDSLDPSSTELLEYTLSNGETYSTVSPIMSIDSNITYIKYDNSTIKLRVNFKGIETGVYTDDTGVFYKFSYDSTGQSSIDVICDTFTGISVNVTEYGDVGGYIEGTFTANNCDGESNAPGASGNFRVLRTE